MRRAPDTTMRVGHCGLLHILESVVTEAELDIYIYIYISFYYITWPYSPTMVWMFGNGTFSSQLVIIKQEATAILRVGLTSGDEVGCVLLKWRKLALELHLLPDGHCEEIR
jgi:hypothetical protein